MASAFILIAGVRAALRLYQAGDRALTQAYRDADRVFPSVPTVFVDGTTTPQSLKLEHDVDSDFRDWITSYDLGDTFQDMLGGDKKALATIIQAREGYAAVVESPNQAGTAMERVEYERLRQWSNDADKPIAPATRFALVLADVAAEFISANPGLLARGGTGERLIGSFATQVSDMIPNDENFGPRQRLGSRLLGMVFRAGLQTATDNKDIFASEDHQKALVDALTGPVLAQFPNNMTLADELQWSDVLDAFAGPALSAAFGVIAENQTDFLGAKFGSEKILGKLNLTLLETLRDRGFEGTFTEEGVIQLYRGALGVVAENPELVVSGDSARDDFVRSLVTGFAQTLSDDKLIASGDTEDYGLALALAALNAFKGNADALLDLGGDPLEQVASSTLQNVLEALTGGLADGKRLDEIFGKDLALELAQNVLTEVAKQPALFKGKEELEIIVTALTKSMASGKRLDEVFGTGMAADLVTNILQEIANHPTLLADKDELKTIVEALGASMSADNIGHAFVAELMRSTIAEIAANSELVQSHEELGGILTAIGAAISADKKQFLTESDWKGIIASLLRKAADNPGRLFGIEPGNPGSQLAVQAITTLLDAAADQVNGTRTDGGLLFGETLKTAIEATLSAVASNPARVAAILVADQISGETQAKLAWYIDQISAAVKIKPDGVHFAMGSKEWLRLYRAILMRLLNENDRLSQVMVALTEDGGKTLTAEGEALIQDILTTFVPIGS